MRVTLSTSAVFGIAVLGISLATATPAAASASQSPSVLHVGQIDHQDVASQPGSEPETLVEPDVAVSPSNPQIAVAVAHDGRFPDGGAVDIGYAWTHDGGASWHHAPMQNLTKATGGRWARASDPVVAFAPSGDVYISALVFNTGCASGVAVARSTDGGATFGAPVLAHASRSCDVSDDKNWLVVDDQANSPFKGRLYQFWTAFLTVGGNPAGSPQYLRWSDDQGAHWSPITTVSGAHENTQNSQAVIQPDGTITDVYLGRGMDARTSHDGGATWSPEVVVTPTVGGGPRGIRCCLPAAAADPATGQLYAVWEARGPDKRDAVRISTSTDGRHWSAPGWVTHDSDNPNVQYVNSTVTADAGRVFVSYGRRDLSVAHGELVQQQVEASYDAGKSFGAPISLGPPSDLRYAAVAGGKFPGDYIGASATRTAVVLVWCVSSQPGDASDLYHQTLYAAVLRP